MLLSHRLADYLANPVSQGIASGNWSTVGTNELSGSGSLSYPTGSQAGDLAVFTVVRSVETSESYSGWTIAQSMSMPSAVSVQVEHHYKILSSSDVSGNLPTVNNPLQRGIAVFRLNRSINSISVIGENNGNDGATQSGVLTMTEPLTLPCLVVGSVRTTNSGSTPTISNGGNTTSISIVGTAYQSVNSGGVTTARSIASVAFGTSLFFVKGIFALVAN